MKNSQNILHFLQDNSEIPGNSLIKLFDTSSHINKLNLLAAFAVLLVFLSGCETHSAMDSPTTDQFGRTGTNPLPAIPFKADGYVVKVGDLEYTPNVISARGEWFQLRWYENGNYLRNDVWVPMSSILAIEEKHE